jgi:hypothetical protein
MTTLLIAVGALVLGVIAIAVIDQPGRSAPPPFGWSCREVLHRSLLRAVAFPSLP